MDYYPVSNTSLWIEWRLWGANPVGYHAVNLLLHIVLALLIWKVLARLKIPGAFLAALLFAVHPVNVESVAWISQRKDLLAILFLLLSTLCWLRTQRIGDFDALRHGRQSSLAVAAGWYVLSLAMFVFAMLSKGSVAILPVLFLLIVWWQRRRIGWTDFLRTIPFFLIAAALTVVNMAVQTRGFSDTIRSASFAHRLTGAGAAVWFYLAKALLPINLAFIYPQWHVHAHDVLWLLPLAAAAVVTVVLAIPKAQRWRRSLFFAWAFFCVALAPMLGFVDVASCATRWWRTTISTWH